MIKKHNINVIVDGELGHGRYTVARRIKELIENDEKLEAFNIAVKVTTTDDVDLNTYKSIETPYVVSIDQANPSMFDVTVAVEDYNEAIEIISELSKKRKN